MLVTWVFETICFAVYSKTGHAAAGHAFIAMICELSLVWCFGGNYNRILHEIVIFSTFCEDWPILLHKSYWMPLTWYSIDAVRLSSVPNLVGLSDLSFSARIFSFNRYVSAPWALEHWFCFLNRGINSYTVEILPYNLRFKGFTIFNFTISLSLIFNQ